MGRLDDLRVIDPVLSKLADDYSNEAYVYSKLFPAVKVEKLAGQIPQFGKEAFIARTTNRAIRAKSNRIPPTDLDMVSFELTEHDVEIALDSLEISEASQAIKLEARVVRELTETLMVAKEKEVADYVQLASNYATGLKNEVLVGGAWDNYALTTVYPLLQIETAKKAIHDLIAVDPNTMIIGYPVVKTLFNHPNVIDKVAYAGLAQISIDILKSLTGIPNIYIGKSMYSSDGGSTLTNLWSDNLVIAYVDQSDKSEASEFNPSYAYELQKSGYPLIDKYEENGGKIQVYRSTDIYTMKVINSNCAYLISNVNHTA